MTILHHQPPRAAVPDRLDRMLRTLAYLADAYSLQQGGPLLAHALRACILADWRGLAPAAADEKAGEEAWTDADRAVADYARELIEQARRTAQAADYDEQPVAVTR